MNLRKFLIDLWRKEDGIFGIDEGPSSGETGATNSLNGESGFAGSVGEGLLSNSSALINGLLSGNEADIGKLLAPQIGAISKQANEKTQTNATFGARSGGTNASNQNTIDSARSSVNDMISSLTSGAIGEGASLGSNLLSQGMQGNEAVFNQQQQMQQQRAAKWNDIAGSAASVAGSFFGIPHSGGGGFSPEQLTNLDMGADPSTAGLGGFSQPTSPDMSIFG